MSSYPKCPKCEDGHLKPTSTETGLVLSERKGGGGAPVTAQGGLTVKDDRSKFKMNWKCDKCGHVPE